MSQARILIGVMGIDQHENGAIAVTRFLREAQMEVSYAGVFNTAESLFEKAMKGEVDVIGISCHSWEYIHYLPELMERLGSADRTVPVVVGGSVLTPKDREELQKLGVAGVFPAGSEPDDIVDAIRDLAAERVRQRTEAALTD
ncbi:MAG: cobalamin-dependent protein [Alphaproteobacteria bacterium]|jgi:methylmalonyl-CoA mutase C-terminal domain/subunit|nr:cobalamin-dependent protein [Alphaproteobacteria bacterium]